MLKLLKQREFTLFALIIVLLAAISMRAPNFLNFENFNYILNDTSILVMVAVGQLLVIVTGGIDLSVASGIALSGMVVGMLNQHFPGIPIEVILLISLGIGCLLGSFNGLLVSVANIPPIITTLGTMSIYRGFVFVLSKGEWVSAHEMTEAFRDFPRVSIMGISNLILIAVIVVIIAAVFLKYSKTGREIYGVGGNKVAARFVGISIKKINYLVFALSGVIVGLAGFLWVARYASAQNETAFGFELQTIAACVIGGVSIAGGSGTVPGVVLGALFLGILNNALTVINLSPFYQMGIQGLVIILAIIANTLVDKRNQLSMLRKRKL
ncbi:Ribose import permease protein RbsC [subsurface metagenome]